jgi:N-acetylglucosaminyl-diphospho-decaprenol L-rhamnosyltransferase
MPTAQISVSLVVVTHDSASLLPGFAMALAGALEGVERHEVVVVDSGSTDGSAEQFAALMPGAIVVDLGGNLGYAAGLNAGVAATRLGGPVLLLNPDIRPAAGAVARLVDALSGDAVGITVPRLVGEHGETQPSLRRRPTVTRALGEAVLGGPRAGRIHALGELVLDPRAYDHPSTVDWATGAVMCVTRRCLEVVGTWDESYFLYSEETDFALRAGDAGFSTVYVPAAEVVHFGGDAHIAPSLFALLNVNRVRAYRARHGRLATASFRAAIGFGLAGRALAGSTRHRHALRALFEDPDVVVARARAGSG